MKTNSKVFGFLGMVLLAVGCSQATTSFEKDSVTSTTTDTTVMASGIQNKAVEREQDKSSEKDGTYKTVLTPPPPKSETDQFISPLSGSSSAAVENLKDTLHKFIRTADIKFKVENVEKTTYKIEDIVASHNGFVTLTSLTSHINNISKTQVSADSSAETTNFSVTNYITLRVPNTQLDTTLKDIAKLVGFLDYRLIKAEDVSLQLLANNLLQKRTAQHAQRLAKDIDANHKKLDESADAEDNLLARQEAADEATISNLSMAEQRQFSTVKLELYQPETIATTIVVSPKPLPTYQVSFAPRLWHSLQFGWNMLEDISLAIISCWVFILLGLIGYILYKKYTKVVKVS